MRPAPSTAAADSIPAAGICTISEDGTILACSAALCIMLGYERPELEGMGFSTLVYGRSRGEMNLHLARLRDGTYADVAGRGHFLTRQGRILSMNYALQALPAAGQSAPAITVALASSQPDTHAGQSLNDAAATVESLVSLLNVGIVYLGLDLVIDYCTAPFGEFMGAAPEDLVGLSLLDLARGGDLGVSAEELLRLLTGGTRQYSVDVRFRRITGGETPTATTLALGRDDRGRPAYFTAAVRNISKRQEALEAAVSQRTMELEAERARFSMLFNESPDAYLVISARDVIIRDCNRSAERMLGVPRSEIVGRSPTVFEPEFQPDGRRTPDLIRDILSRMEAHGIAHADMLRRRLDGSEFWVSASVSRSYVDGSSVNLWTWRDIGERRKLERDLEVARHKAELANRAKSEFLAAMSHEIRTPLNAVVNTSYLLQQGRMLPEQRRDFEVIEAAAGALMMVVNDVLDISKIEAGEFAVDPRPFSLAELIRDTLKLFETPARRKNLDVTVAGDAAAPGLLLADSDCLRHVLNNLLANAVKFTEQGSIRLTVHDRMADPAAATHRLRFEVSDTGIGIPPDRMPRLFQSFSQADSSTTRKYGGTGLGLFIVRRLVELMGGTFGAHSQLGVGSTFWFEVDARAHAPGAAARRGEPAKDGLIVGHCGGSAGEQAAFAALCTTLGWTVQLFATIAEARRSAAAAHGIDALVLAGDDADDTIPDLVVLRQPDLTSADAAHRLFDLLNERFRKAGHDAGFLASRTALKAGALPWLRGATVMAVDDSGTNLEILGRILESAGARALTRESGAAAVDTVASDPGAVDLVLMDLQMPGMDGCEAAVLIRRIPGAEDLPILALTAGATTSEKDRALAAGMTGFLTKPVNAARLIRTVRAEVEAHRGRPLLLAVPAAEVLR